MRRGIDLLDRGALQIPHFVWDDNCGKASMERHFLQKTQALGHAA